RGEQIVILIRPFGRRRFDGGDRFVPCLGFPICALGGCCRFFRLLRARRLVGGNRLLAVLGVGVRAVGCCRPFRLGCFSLGCFSLILAPLGQQTLTENAHGANRRIEYGRAGGCFADRSVRAGRRRCRRIRSGRLLGRRR